MIVIATFILRSPTVVSDRAHGYIYNKLDLGPTLTVHCWSKNDDLGEQDIPPKDFWQFSFGTDFFQRTRFDCTFKRNDEVHNYPIYVQTRDTWICGNCTWALYQSGPCRELENDKSCDHWA
ncbi:hypothetical protein MLD38_030827 [Melastoma candidum]|uniref:Uncharacterized protein n=1 Tax=Melastoma candidum TaxID=119954 RepID=A0ACB9MMW9_9MYRT|nr:hypothetical protein MLD38_030827 [Melastoma candidum]